MAINNGFNILPWYDSLEKQNSKKWYAFGQSWPLACPQNIILPFQFVSSTPISIESNIYAVNLTDGTQVNLGVKPEVIAGTQAEATYYIVKQPLTSLLTTLPVGRYYFKMNTSIGQLYSEEVTVVDNITDYIKIEYWNENTLNFTSGEINFDDDFRFVLYIPSTIGKPEYEFEEELTKRLGYKFIESQTSNKIYKFNFLAPEYICDAMRLIRLCDYIKLTTKYDTYNALSFTYEPKWQDNGDLAAVDVEFDTDCIIQKLESFNRRLKESFYNALLADIDEPVLFSNDIVAQYYTEFTTTSYINGKLIRQLEAINEADLGSLENLVLPIDNQADTEQKAKKITLASLKNVLIKLADYVTLTTAQNINGEKNFIGGLKVNGSPIIYDSVNKCWKLQGNLVLTGGITMYADDGSLNLPSIYDGLPIDGTTIYWDTDAAGNRVLKAVGGGGTAESVAWNNITGKPSWIGSSKPTYSYSEIQNTPDLSQYATKTEVSKKWTQDDTKIVNWDSAFGWGNHANAGYAKKTYVDETFVNLTGEQTISGKKNFTTGGLFVNGSQIKYDSTKKYWKLEGDLLVTGGITMYGNEGTYTPSTIMDAISVDGTTISKSGGVLKVIGGTGGGSVEGLASVAYSGKYDDLIGKPTLLSSFTDDIVSGKYLPLSGGTISGDLFVANSYGGLVFTNTNLNSNAFLFYNGDSNWYVTNKDWGASYKIWHSGIFEPYNYLPKSGGTLTGDLIFQENWGGMNSILRDSMFPAHIYRLVWSTNGDVYDHYYNNNYTSSTYTSANLRVKANENYLTLRFCGDGTFTWNGEKVWHSGNDGNGSGLDADLLDGVHNGELTAQYFSRGKLLTSADTIDTLMSGVYCYINGNNPTGSIDDNTILLAFRNESRTDMFQLMGAANTGRLYYRLAANVGNSYENWYGWRVVAFEDSNVTSATKLQTARTIWGQSFDGTGNVEGKIKLTSWDSDGTALRLESNSTSNSNAAYISMYVYDGNAYKFGQVADRFVINHNIHGDVFNIRNGNVGIGLTTPNHKLHVLGQILAQDGELISYNIINGSTTKKGGFLQLVGYYTPTSEAWSAYIASDYLGAQWCTTGGFTHGMIFKSGRRGFDNFIFLDSSGNPVARISASNTGMNHHFVGDMLVTGGITMYSDKRKKTILNHVELSLKQIADAPLIEHYYNNDRNKVTHVGSIAQYWASMNDWFCKQDSEGFLTMEIQNAALASAISIARELDRYETKTDKTIKQLRKRICQLEDELEKLKSA